MTIYSPIIVPKVGEISVSHQTKLGVANYDLMDSYSPDTAMWKSKVLDLASPKYQPSKTNSNSYIFDKSRYCNHGTIYVATLTRLPSGLWAPLLDGSDDYIDCGNKTSLDSIVMITVEAWVRPTGTHKDGYGGIWFDQATTAVNRILLSNDGSLLAQYTIGGVGKAPTAPVNSAPLNMWTYIILTYDQSEIVFWVNGLKGTPVAASGTISPSINNRLVGRGHAETYNFKGNIALFCVYNQALLASEIQNRYNQTRSLFGV